MSDFFQGRYVFGFLCYAYSIAVFESECKNQEENAQWIWATPFNASTTKGDLEYASNEENNVTGMIFFTDVMLKGNITYTVPQIISEVDEIMENRVRAYSYQY